MPHNYYKGAIWTNHALEKLNERGLSQDMASSAFNNPDKSYAGQENGTTKHQKRFDKSIVTVVAKQNEKGEWIILSCWIDPPLKGTEDEKRKTAYRAYQKASFWEQVWITIKRQLGFSN